MVELKATTASLLPRYTRLQCGSRDRGQTNVTRRVALEAPEMPHRFRWVSQGMASHKRFGEHLMVEIRDPHKDHVYF